MSWKDVVRISDYNYLTAHYWQKWKCTFLMCHCQEIYTEEAFGLKNSNYT